MQAPSVLKAITRSRLVILSLFALTASPLFASDPFTKPTPEELAMTSVPGYPGAPAVILYKEQVTRDELHVIQHYERVKILNEEGKKYANVELSFANARNLGFFQESEDVTVGDIAGRTIHPDGTIVPFTGKPYLKTVEQGKDFKVQQKVFTLPDVTVGSIIEYRYATRFSDYFYSAPDWFIQGDLFVKSAHFAWYPTSHEMIDSQERIINSISWFPVLPPGVEVKRVTTPRASSSNEAPTMYELTAKDIPPTKKEDHMPPLESFSYRVLFSYTSFSTGAEFWKSEGKQWSKRTDSFIGSTSSLSKSALEITAGATTPDEKLKKIYAAVMQLENTDFTRHRNKSEEKVNNVADVLAQKRGTPTQLTDLFIGLARASGFKAYAMRVPDRSETIFVPSWLSMSQLSSEIAIVSIDGKDNFFDPGERYCGYGQLSWKHEYVGGLRQTDGGNTDLAQTQGSPYTANKTTRVANLTMDDHGELTGKIDLSFYGAPALHWRQEALLGDSESIHNALEKTLEEMIPGSLEVKVSDIKNLEDFEKPLIVNYSAKGTVSTVTGKRLVVPVDLFSVGETATFTHESRELPIDFHYPQTVLDALRINLPKNLSVEAVPDAAKLKFASSGAYTLTAESAPTNVTVRRNFVFNEVLIPVKEYSDLRKFYSQFEAKDKDSIILKTAPVQSAAATPAGN